jgi:hypothetical protein
VQEVAGKTTDASVGVYYFFHFLVNVVALLFEIEYSR